MKRKLSIIIDWSLLLFAIALFSLSFVISFTYSANIFIAIFKVMGSMLLGSVTGIILVFVSALGLLYSSYVLNTHKITGFLKYLKKEKE